MLVAVDTGGTKTLVAVFDTDGALVAKQKFPTPNEIDAYIVQLKQTIDDLIATPEISCISVALPGSIRDGVMIWAGNLSWGVTDIKQLLSEHYSCPMVVENDANLAGLAEARSRGSVPPLCLYLTVSTGIGSGIILDGKIDPLLSRSEAGRMLVHHDGKYALWESFASGKAIRERHGKLASEIKDEAIWREIGANLAVGLLALCPLLRPDAVIIGGGVGAHFDQFSEYLNDELADKLHDGYTPELYVAKHPEEAVIYGCYYHAIDVGVV